MALDQGPGRDIDFYLITTGFNIDPEHGGQAELYYNMIKNVINEKGDLHIEVPDVREMFDMDISNILFGYSPKPRTVYQALFGIVKHNNPWTVETLTQSLENAKFPGTVFPEDKQISIDWQVSREDGFKLFKSEQIGQSLGWIEIETFYYSHRKPSVQEGSNGDFWVVQDNGRLQFWRKSVFKWKMLDENELFIQDNEPSISENKYWIDTTGLKLRRFDRRTSTWSTNLVWNLQSSTPANPNENDVWLSFNNGELRARQYKGKWKDIQFSEYVVIDKETNSSFVGKKDENNFLFEFDNALIGGTLGEGVDSLEIRKDGQIISQFVRCLNFEGVNFNVSDEIDCIRIEHDPVTTLPQQIDVPESLNDSGRLYTKSVDGIAELFFLDENDREVKITSKGKLSQNIFLETVSTTAVPGQTSFSVPNDVRDVVTLKINGLETVNFEFNAPTITYFPGPAGYTVQGGDLISAIVFK